jgi:hypothetical protein
MQLLLRRANVSRKGGPWQHEDYDVFDGTGGAERTVGRIFLVNAFAGSETWFWGLSFEFQLTERKSYGDANSLDDAKAAFKAEYERWQSSAPTRGPTGKTGQSGRC